MEADMIGIFIFLVCAVAIIGSLVIWSLRNGISPMPTSSKVKREMLALMPHNLNGTIYELGCGWGTLLFPLARKYPHCRIIGYETSPLPYGVCKLLLSFFKHSNVEVVRRDFYSANLRDASLVVCYLYPGAMKRLESKFSAELRKETFVVSNTFAIPGWSPQTVKTIDDLYRTKIYLYKSL